jgi:UDP:flavonoid glycosyltransferase YjiC (YdhE family)
MKVLAYTSPARGHLNPMMGPLLELRRRGAEVHVRTLASEVGSVRAAGLDAEPIDPAIERIEMDDHSQKGQIAQGKQCFVVWGARAPLEVADLRSAVAQTAPDVTLVDTTTFGAKAAAEADGLTWAESRPFLLEDPAPGVPPFGLGLKPRGDLVGHLRDKVLGVVASRFDAKARLPVVNAGREAAGLPPLRSAEEMRNRAPMTLYFTAEPFEYPRPLPTGVVMVGAAEWDPPAELPPLPADDRPLVLVVCSSEFQDDSDIALAALAGLTEDYRVVVTTAGVDPATLEPRGGAVIERFLPHSALLPQAAVVICHGGMGITQKALSHGVPVCVVPWGRDQLDVAAHVEAAGAGVTLRRKRLSPETLAQAVGRTRACVAGAARVRAGYEGTGRAAAAADALARLVGEGAHVSSVGTREHGAAAPAPTHH